MGGFRLFCGEYSFMLSSSFVYHVQSFCQWMIELLLPQKKNCVFCGRFLPGSKLSAGLCPRCLLDWRQMRANARICPLCGSFDSGEPCRGPCAGSPGPGPPKVGGIGRPGGMSAIYTAAPYTGVYRQRILAFKYNGHAYLADALACFMAATWLERKIPRGKKPCLVPVPMHKEKEATRGYNQSKLLASALSRRTGLPVNELLSRPNKGQVQAYLDKHQRRKALDQIVQWAGPESPKPGPVILVDDIVTTGATMECCCQILLEKGYGPIWGLAFAGGTGSKSRQ